MIKVLVVVSGLVGFAQHGGSAGDPTGLTAMLVNADRGGHHQHSAGKHVAALRLKLDLASDLVYHFDSAEAKATLAVTNPDATITLDGLNYVAPMAEFSAGQLNEECLEGDCKDSDEVSIVSAIAKFEGRWTTRAVSRCDRVWHTPPEFLDQAKFEVRQRANGSNKPGFNPRRLATGIALEVTLEKKDDLKLELGGVPQEIVLSRQPICEEWLKTTGPCMVFEVENWPAGDLDPMCRGEFDHLAPECKLDVHFAALYDLLLKPQDQTHWMPFITEIPVDCDGVVAGPGQPPAVRCPPVKFQ